MFTKLFIDRPKLSFVISIVISLVGAMALLRLPIAEYPEVAPPCIYVSATYPGASSQVIAETVASIIEEESNGIENMIYFNSENDNNGNYKLYLYFKPGTNDDIAQVNVQNAVVRAETKLPPEVKAIGVKVAKRSSDMLGLYAFTTDGSTLNHLELANYVRMNVRDRFARIDGVTDTEILGERNYSMRVWLNPLKLSNMGISTGEVAAAIQSQNIQAAAGSLGGEQSSEFMQLKIDALGRLQTPDQFANIVVKTDSQGRQVTLGDIARLELGAEYYFSNGYLDGEPSVSVSLYRQSGANAVNVIKSANALLKDISKRFPKGVKGQLVYDPTEYIRRSIIEIAETLILTLVLVVFVTFLFLQDWRATIVPALAIPVSLLGTFFVMLVLDYSINVLTMFGLILVIGLLVDDGIIVVENATRLLEEDENMTPYEAAVESMNQTTGAILASTFVMVAIFAPLSFFGGIVGTIYKQFSLTMCIAIIFSAINALTLSPALCALLLRHNHGKKKIFFFRWFNGILDGTKNGYIGLSKLIVRRGLITLLLLGGVLYLNWNVFTQLDGGFIPNEDKGGLLGELVLPPGASLHRSDKMVRQFNEKVNQIPGVKNVICVSGFSIVSGAGENFCMTIANLEDWSKRKKPELQIQAINNEIMKQCRSIPYGTVMTFQPPAIMGLGTTGGVTFAFCAGGGQSPKDLEGQLGKLLGDLNDKSKFPGVAYAFSSYNASTPMIHLDIDRQKAQALGVPVSSIFSTMQSKIASLYVNDFNLFGYSFKVKLQSEAADRSSLANLEELMIQNNTGSEVPLSAVSKIRYILGAQKITRFNQAMSATVNVIPLPGVSTGDIMNSIQKHLDDEFTTDYSLSWMDMSYHQKGNEGKLGILMLLAIVFGYLFLAAKYESWTVPLSVLFSVSFAMLGGLGAMLYNGMTLDIYAQLSLIMLIGLSAKVSILMVEFSKQERESGKDIVESALNGARFRYRAVMMTACCFVVGVLPLIFATGAGAVSRNIVGIITGWGMIVSTVVGIPFIPPFYATFQRIRECVNGKFSRKKTLTVVSEQKPEE